MSPPRPAVPADAASLQAIAREAYSPYVARIGREPGPMGDDYQARIAAGEAWVIEDQAGIAGFVVIEEGADRFVLDNIAVALRCHGAGLGRTLMGFAERRARERGQHAIRLYTHVLMSENIAWYRRLGFVETGRASERGFERVYMAKPLT